MSAKAERSVTWPRYAPLRLLGLGRQPTLLTSLSATAVTMFEGSVEVTPTIMLPASRYSVDSWLRSGMSTAEFGLLVYRMTSALDAPGVRT